MTMRVTLPLSRELDAPAEYPSGPAVAEPRVCAGMRPVGLVTARFVETGAKSGRPRLGWTEIGPKRCFFGPIPAEMGGNWPKRGRQAGPPPPLNPSKQAKLRAGERLDRTQEVAGSSPASSIKEIPANAMNPGSAPSCRAANLGQNSQ